MDPYADMSCHLKVNVQCDACKMKMMEVLGSISGVYSVTINAEEGIAKISGEVDPNILLGALARSDKHAELVWVKLKHPLLNRGSYNYNNNYYGYGSSSYRADAIDVPSYGYGRALPEHPYYDTYPRGRPPMLEYDEFPSNVYNNTNYRYDYQYQSPPARYVPSEPQPVYDEYDFEPISFCSIL